MPPADDDLPAAEPVPPPPPARDPLLDDPFFAEAVPAVPALNDPLIGDPVAADIVLDDPVPVVVPLPLARPVVPVEAEPLPRAEPVAGRPRAVRAEPTPPKPRRADTQPPRHEHSAAARAQVEADPGGPRPRVFVACSVVGCLGVVVLAALGFLAYAAVSLLGQVGDQFGSVVPDTPPPEAARRPGPVEPTLLRDERTTFMLAGPVDAVGRGANGRYLVLRSKTAPTIQLFDPVPATVVRTIPVGELGTPFAAGAAKLFVYRPVAGELVRFDLATGQQELSVPWRSRPDALAIGPGSDGPLFAFTHGDDKTEVAAIDAATLVVGESRTVPEVPRTRPVRTAANGLLLGVSRDGTNPGLLLRYRTGAGFLSFQLGDADPQLGHVAPSPDGQFVYTARGAFAPDDSPNRWRHALEPEGAYFYTLPTAHGSGLFLSLPVKGQRFDAVALHLAGNRKVVATLTDLVPPGVAPDDKDPIPADLRVHLWPAAGLAAVLPVGNDRLELHRVDVAQLLRTPPKSDYLVIGSEPHTVADRGLRWTYTPWAWSSVDQTPRVRKLNGPSEMRVEPNGQLAWEVPADFAGAEVEVRIEATVTAGKKSLAAEQRFRLVVPPRP